jgi:hypothetical protein
MNNVNLNQTFIIEPQLVIEGTIITNSIISYSGDSTITLTSGSTIFNSDILPVTDGNISLGNGITRFRNINTISGSSTVWTTTTKISTPMVDLGMDDNNNIRQITANNSIIQNDILLGGNY